MGVPVAGWIPAASFWGRQIEGVGRMRRTRGGVVALCALVSAAAVLAACTDEPPPTMPQDDTTLSIAVLAPLTGDSAQSGRGAVAAVNAVVTEYRDELAEVGVTVSVDALDDRGQQSVGQQRVTSVIDAPGTVALIGSVSSVVDEGVQPIAAHAGLPMVSLGGSDRDLVIRAGERPFATYFTLAARSADRAAVSGRQELDDPRRVVIVRGDRDVDREMAATFEGEVERRSGVVVLNHVVDEAAWTSDQVGIDAELARLTGRLGQVQATAVYVVTPEPLIWPLIGAVREVSPTTPIILDEPAVGRWSESLTLDEQETSEAGGASWGPITVVTTGADAQLFADEPPTPTPSSSGPPRTSSNPGPTEPPGEVEGLEPVGRYAESAERAATAVIRSLLVALHSDASSGPSSAPATSDVDVDVDARTVRLRNSISEQLGGEVMVAGSDRIDRFGVASSREVGVFVRRNDSWVPSAAWTVRGDCAVPTACGQRRAVGSDS